MIKILVVDDNTMNLDILKDALKEDYKLAFAKNGKMALKIMSKNKPDLILLDVLMPVMDGYETYRQIKVDEGLKVIPVIFLSGLDDVDKDLVSEVSDDPIVHLRKPFDIELVESTIIDSLNRR